MTIQDITFRELSPDRLPDLETLFGERGACGGCWCIYWRIHKGERWEEIKGQEARERMRTLVRDGEFHGVLAYANGNPVGWCAFGPKKAFDRLLRSPSLGGSPESWAIPCFFVHKEFRGKGISRGLLAAAVAAIRSRAGNSPIEAYPEFPRADGKRTPPAFAWTGPYGIFGAMGFQPADDKSRGKIRMRLAQRSTRSD